MAVFAREAQPRGQQINLVIVVDDSGSMSGTPMAKAKEVTQKLMRTVLGSNAASKVGIVRFAGTASVMQTMTSDVTTLESAINSIYSGGSTNIEAGLNTGYQQIMTVNDPKIRNVMVLLGDGLPETGKSQPGIYDLATWGYNMHHYGSASVYAAQGIWPNCDIYTVGFFHNAQAEDRERGYRLLTDIQNYGYFNAQNDEELDKIFDEIGKDLIDQVAVETLVLTPNPMHLPNIGDTGQITPIFTPSNATNKSVLYTSTNERIATVNPVGIVTAVANGSCEIIGTTVNGKTARMTVHVGPVLVTTPTPTPAPPSTPTPTPILTPSTRPPSPPTTPPAVVTPTPSPTPTKTPSVGSITYRALLIANDNAPSHKDNLVGKNDDTRFMKEALDKTQYKGNITIREDRTVKQMQNDVKLAFQKADDNDVSFLYLSGYGVKHSNGNVSIKDKNGSFWSVTTLRKQLEKVPGNIVVIFDMAHSNAFITKDASGASMDDALIDLFSSDALAKALTGKKFRVLTSSTDAKNKLMSPTYTKTHVSVFTSSLRTYILAEKTDANKDGEVSLAELYDDINFRMEFLWKRTCGVYPKNDKNMLFEVEY